MEAKERAKVVDQLIAEAVEREAVAMLRVLHTELPSYLQPSWPGIVPTVQKVTDALLPLARGIERTALEARAELDDQAAAAEIDYNGDTRRPVVLRLRAERSRPRAVEA